MIKYILRNIDTKEIVLMSLDQILENINGDRSEDWTNYNETDWREGLKAFTEFENIGEVSLNYNIMSYGQVMVATSMAIRKALGDLTIHEQLKQANVPLSGHCSDLYAKVTDESKRIVQSYEYLGNVRTFICELDDSLWFDIPFANDNYWEAKANRKHKAALDQTLLNAGPMMVRTLEACLNLLQDPDAEPSDADEIESLIIETLAKARGEV